MHSLDPAQYVLGFFCNLFFRFYFQYLLKIQKYSYLWVVKADSPKDKIMKTFKLIDFWINVILISFFVIIAILETSDCISGFDGYIIWGYFIVGGWQVISMIVHATQQWFTEKKGTRYYYHWFTFFAVFAMVTLIWFYVLLFIAPFLALFYTWICYNETFVKMKRPLADLV